MTHELNSNDGTTKRGQYEELVEAATEVNAVSIAAEAGAKRPSIAHTLLLLATAASQASALFASAAVLSAEADNDARDAIASKAAKLCAEIADASESFVCDE